MHPGRGSRRQAPILLLLEQACAPTSACLELRCFRQTFAYAAHGDLLAGITAVGSSRARFSPRFTTLRISRRGRGDAFLRAPEGGDHAHHRSASCQGTSPCVSSPGIPPVSRQRIAPTRQVIRVIAPLDQVDIVNLVKGRCVIPAMLTRGSRKPGAFFCCRDLPVNEPLQHVRVIAQAKGLAGLAEGAVIAEGMTGRGGHAGDALLLFPVVVLGPRLTPARHAAAEHSGCAHLRPRKRPDAHNP